VGNNVVVRFFFCFSITITDIEAIAAVVSARVVLHCSSLEQSWQLGFTSPLPLNSILPSSSCSIWTNALLRMAATAPKPPERNKKNNNGSYDVWLNNIVVWLAQLSSEDYKRRSCRKNSPRSRKLYPSNTFPHSPPRFTNASSVKLRTSPLPQPASLYKCVD
jgi:hypothetical protein